MTFKKVFDTNGDSPNTKFPDMDDPKLTFGFIADLLRHQSTMAIEFLKQ